MTDLFPGLKTFLIVLATIFIANIVVVAIGIPYLPFIIGIAFLAWLIWGLISGITAKRRNS